MVSLHAFVLVAALTGSSDLVLLDFSADWCVPCRSMEPTLARLEEAGYPVRRINVDQSPDLARRFGIGPIPCFVLVQDGNEVQRVVGATSYDRIVQMYRQAGYGTASPSGGNSPAPSNVRGQSPDRQILPPVQPAQPHLVPLTNTPPPINNLPPKGNPAGNNRFAGGGSVLPGRPMTAASNALAAVANQPTQAHQLALQATVRLQVTDATGRSKGTGTIIDVHGNEALVLTCGHIFRESQGKGEIQVELFAPGTRGPVSGHLLAYECEQRDFGLVSIRPDTPVTPVKVATAAYHPQPGESIFSIGCDHGADPTVRVSVVSAVDRYVGPPNIEIQGHPAEGRSGGGLFTTDGRIIGICNAADLEDDHGIYAGLPTIHLALDTAGLREIYRREAYQGEQSGRNQALAGNVPRVPPTTGTTPQPGAPAMLNLAAQRTPSASQREMICVVRLPDGASRVVVIKNPSTDLLRQLAVESQQQTLPAGPAPGPQEIARRSAPGLAPESAPAPIVRGQGY